MSSCFDCGAQVAEEDRFCGNCGIAIRPGGGDPAAAGGDAAPSSASPAGEPSSPSLRAAQTDGAAVQEQTGVRGDETPDAEEDYSEDLQPTIIESSHGGQATAAARAHESPTPADSSSSDLASSSSDSSDR